MLNTLKDQAFGITKRLRKRDFSGNTGLAIKNSIYSFSTNALAKLGSIIFVYLILMRQLSEEVFGLYSLALATILIFAGFSDLGINTALIRYVSKNGKNSRGYISYLAKLKIWLTILVSIIMAVLAVFFLDKIYPGKPISLALIAGIFYIAFSNLSNFIGALFHAKNNFKIPFFREIIFQASRIVIIPIIIFLTLSRSSEEVLFFIFLGLSLCYLILSYFLFLKLENYSGTNLSRSKKLELKKFILPLSVTALSGTFFGYIDTIMLGRYVASEFVAYYQAAFSLITSAAVFISFSSVLFPIFSRLDGKRLTRGLKKSLLITIPLSIIGILLTWILSPLIFQFVNFVTGRDYSSSILLLRLLSFVLLTDPLISIFSSYLTSMGRTKKIAKAIVLSTFVNIFLNYFLITGALRLYGNMYYAVIGAIIATIVSRFVYLGLLVFKIGTERR